MLQPREPPDPLCFNESTPLRAWKVLPRIHGRSGPLHVSMNPRPYERGREEFKKDGASTKSFNESTPLRAWKAEDELHLGAFLVGKFQ